MDDVLSDLNKFTKVNLKNYPLLNFAVKQEKLVGKVLKKLLEFNNITEKTVNC